MLHCEIDAILQLPDGARRERGGAGRGGGAGRKEGDLAMEMTRASGLRRDVLKQTREEFGEVHQAVSQVVFAAVRYATGCALDNVIQPTVRCVCGHT